MFLGIEIGGTKLQLGIGPGDGVLQSLWRGAVVPSQGAAGIRKQIEAAVPDLLARANLTRDQLQGVGIGFGGPVDDVTRSVIKSHQIEGWNHFPLADWISEVVGLPAVLGNDADVAGFAEALFGAGKGVSPIFYITIGSGIGGGLIINGEIYRGAGRGAAEIGHVNFHLPVDGAAGGKLEELASGWAIDALARQQAALPANENTLLLPLVHGNVPSITARHVAVAAAQGDPLANAILSNPRSILAHAITQVIVLLCPRRIIIGGGVALIGHELFFGPLATEVDRLVASQFPVFTGCYVIVPAALGEQVVIHGALALARKHLS